MPLSQYCCDKRLFKSTCTSQDNAFALLTCLLVLIFAHLSNSPLHSTHYKAKILALKFLLDQILQNWIKSNRTGKEESESSNSHDYYKLILNLISKHPILGQLWPFTSNLKYGCVYFPNPIHCSRSIFILSISRHVCSCGLCSLFT